VEAQLVGAGLARTTGLEQCQGRVICKALARGLLCCQQLPQAAQHARLEAELLADGGEPVEQAAGGRPGGLDDIAAFQEFDPAAGPRDAHQLADDAGPGASRDGGDQGWRSPPGMCWV
jgi:hypothetical protein